MRIVRSGVVMAVLAAALFWTASPAHACSCAAPNVAEGLAFSDAAFVGTFEGRTDDKRRGEWGEEVGYGFAVEEWIKGEGPSTVTVWSSGDGASCGLEVGPGERVGIFARARQGELSSDLCSTIGANMLLAAVSSAVVIGEGAVHFVVAGNFAEGSIAYLDSLGRPLGYLLESEPGGWGELRPCPGGATVVFRRGDSDIDIIDLATGERRPIDLDLNAETSYVSDLNCLAPDGSDVAVLIEQFATGVPSYTVGRIDPVPRKVGVLPSIRGGQPRLVGDKVVIAESNESGGRVRVFDPATGEMSAVAEVERDGSGDDHAGYDQPIGSPDGTRAAIVEGVYPRDGDPTNTVLVIDLESGEVTRSRSNAGERWGIFWLDDDHLGAPTSFDGSSNAGMAVLDATSLEEVTMVEGFGGFRATKIDDALWSIDGSQVQRASITDGTLEVTHTFAAAAGELVSVADPFEPPAELTAPSVGGFVDAAPPTTRPPVGVDGEEAGGFDGGPLEGPDGGSGSSATLWLGIGALAIVTLTAATWAFTRRKAL